MRKHWLFLVPLLLLTAIFARAQSSMSGTGGGGGNGVFGTGSSLFATSAVTAAGKTLAMDGQFDSTTNCSSTAGSHTIVCTDGPFRASDATGPKQIWAVDGAGALCLAHTTISAFTSATTITVVGAWIPNANCKVIWGTDDTAAWDAVTTAMNTGLIHQQTCVITPTGLTIISHAELLVPTGAAGIYPFCADSLGRTVFAFTPDFTWSTCVPSCLASTAQGISYGPGNEPSYLNGLYVEGFGLLSGAGTFTGFPGSGAFIFFSSQLEGHNFGCDQFGDGVSSMGCLKMDNNSHLYNLLAVDTGITPVTVQGGGFGIAMAIYGGEISVHNNGSGALVIGANQSLDTYGVQFCLSTDSCWYAATVNSGATWISHGDSFGGGSHFTINMAGGEARFIGVKMKPGAAGNGTITSVSPNSVVKVSESEIQAAAGQKAIDMSGGGTAFEDCTNKIAFPSDAVATGNCGVFGIGTGVGTANIASPGLFLNGPSSSVNAFTNTTATTIVATASKTGTLRDLICTSTAAGVNASSGVVTVRTAPLSTGTFAATAITATFGTTTSAKDQTHTAAVTLGQPIQIGVTTQTAETLAGVYCTLVIR